RTVPPRRARYVSAWFRLQLFGFNDQHRLDAQIRAGNEVGEWGADLWVCDARVQERWLQPVVDGTGARLCTRVAVELRRRVERGAVEWPFPIRPLGLRDGLHEPAGPDADSAWRLRHPQCGDGDDSRHRSGEYDPRGSRCRRRRPYDVA